MSSEKAPYISILQIRKNVKNSVLFIVITIRWFYQRSERKNQKNRINARFQSNLACGGTHMRTFLRQLFESDLKKNALRYII